MIIITALASLYGSPNFLSGIITDQNNDPIGYASIEYPSANLFATSNENGYFVLHHSIQADEQIIIHRIGYANQKVTLNNSNTIHIVLKQEPIQMEMIAVEGESPFPSLTADEYHVSLNQSSIHALANNIPGVQLRSSGGSLAANRSLSLNGGPANHTKVSLSGVDLTSSQNGLTDLSQIPLPLQSRISASPLPGVFYGSGAIDGVFNIDPDSRQSSLHFSAGDFGFRSLHAEFNTSTGSWNTQFSTGFTKEHGNFQYPDGDSTSTRQNNHFDQRWIYGSVKGAVTKQIFLSAFSLLSIQDRGIAGGINWLSPHAVKKDTLQIHSVSIGYPFKSGHVHLNYSHRNSGEEYIDDNPFFPIQSHHILTTDHIKLSLVIRPLSFLQIQSLAEHKKEFINSTDTGSHSRTILSASTRLDWTVLPQIHVIPAYRYDGLIDSDQNHTYDVRMSFNPLTNTHISFAGGTTFQYPGFNDLYYEDMFGSLGNAALKPESSTFYTAEFKQDLNQHGFVSVSYTDRKSRDLIQWHPIDESGYVWTPVNIAKTRRTTFSIAGEFTPNHIPVTLNGHYSIIDPKDEITGEVLLYTPDKIGMLGLIYNHAAFISEMQMHYTGERHYTVTEYDENWIPKTIDKKMSDFLTVSLSAKYTVSILQRQFALHLSVNNVLDEDVRMFADYPEPGRTINAGVSYLLK